MVSPLPQHLPRLGHYASSSQMPSLTVSWDATHLSSHGEWGPTIAPWILTTSCKTSTLGKVQPTLLKGGCPEPGSSILGCPGSLLFLSPTPLSQRARAGRAPSAALETHIPAQPAGPLASSLTSPPLGSLGKCLGQSQA